MNLCLRILVLASCVLWGQVFANTGPGPGAELAEVVQGGTPQCRELLDPNAAIHFVYPLVSGEGSHAIAGGHSSVTHKFAEAFTFIGSNYVLIRHEAHPGEELITARSLVTGERLASLFWRGKDGRLFSVGSVAFDVDSLRIAALAHNFFTDKTDAVVLWDGRDGKLDEHVEIEPLRDQDYRPFSAGESSIIFRTGISFAHPFFLRADIRRARSGRDSDSQEFAAQIVDWKSKGTLNLLDADVDLSVVGSPLNSRFGYAAILLDGGKTLQLIPFADIARRMNEGVHPASGMLVDGVTALPGVKEQSPAIGADEQLTSPAVASQSVAARPQFSVSLIHQQKVELAILSNSAPILITQTKEGLHIWNAQEGAKIGFIKGEGIKSFRVLDQMGLLAYTDSSNKLFLYSISHGREVATFSDFKYYYLHSRLEDRTPGIAYITLENGTVMQVSGTFAQGSWLPDYTVSSTGVHLKLPENMSYRTVVETSKGRYLALVYELYKRDVSPGGGSVKSLVIDFFSLDGRGEKVASQVFPVQAFQSQFSLDPTGQWVVFTSSEIATGILSLGNLLEEKGL